MRIILNTFYTFVSKANFIYPTIVKKEYLRVVIICFNNPLLSSRVKEPLILVVPESEI